LGRGVVVTFDVSNNTNTMNTFEKLQDAIATTFKVPANKITETTKHGDIATWDSLGHVSLMMTLEQTFDVFLDVEDFPKLNSVPAIIEYLRGQGIE
jgi:acyl carrier protein